MREYRTIFRLREEGIMKFTKILCVIAAFCLAAVMAACGENTSVDMDNSGNVIGNGGFVVETGDYVYFINGVETYSTEYKTGEVVKGALMRVKKSDFPKLGTADWANVNSETVVSKLIVSDDYTAGFYIFGDYVYYAVPSAEKDNTGTLKNTKLNFFRTKLDGTSTSSKLTNQDFDKAASFRFAANGDKVYLAVYSTSLYVYDAATGKQVYSYEKTIDELLFDDDNGSAVYFTAKPVNANLYDPDSADAKQVKYQNVYKYVYGEEKETEYFSGKGKYEVGDNHTQQSGEGVSLTGATVDLLKHKDGYLYFSYTSLDSTVPFVKYVRQKDGTKDIEVLNNDKNAKTVFADGSYYYGGENLVIYYVSSTYGLMKYDYKNASAGDFGSVAYYSDEIKSSSILGVYDGYMYLYDSSNAYYRVKLDGATEATRINKLAFGASWYKPEVIKVSGKTYIIGTYTDSAYGSYCYAIDVEAAEKAYADYKAALGDDADTYYSDALKAADVKAIVETTLIGKMTETDLKAYTDYYDQLVKNEK